MDHIDAMDQLRQGIHLRAYAQTNPLREYQMEGFAMFEHMIESIEDEVAKFVMKRLKAIWNAKKLFRKRRLISRRTAMIPNKRKAPVRKVVDIGRNAPCHCGSGKNIKLLLGQNSLDCMKRT